MQADEWRGFAPSKLDTLYWEYEYEGAHRTEKLLLSKPTREAYFDGEKVYWCRLGVKGKRIYFVYLPYRKGFTAKLKAWKQLWTLSHGTDGPES